MSQSSPTRPHLLKVSPLLNIVTLGNYVSTWALVGTNHLQSKALPRVLAVFWIGLWPCPLSISFMAFFLSRASDYTDASWTYKPQHMHSISATVIVYITFNSFLNLNISSSGKPSLVTLTPRPCPLLQLTLLIIRVSIMFTYILYITCCKPD